MRKLRSHRKRAALVVAGAAVVPACSGIASLLGSQLYPANYAWNQIITNAPVAANSASIIAHIGNTVHVHPDWGADNPANGTDPLYGIPYNVVHGNSTAKINVSIDNYPGESDIVSVPIPTNAVIEGDYQNGPNPYGAGYDNDNQRGDSHLLVWDEDNNVGYELFGTSRPADTNLFPNTSGDELPHTDGKWHAAQETVWNFGTNSFRVLGETSADAAGLSILAGLVRPDEGATVAQGGQGVINHAFRFTLPKGDCSSQYIYPASHMVSASTGATDLPMGARLRLRNDATVTAKIALMGPQAQNIARAMQLYGLILADIGSAMYVTGTSASQNATNGISLTWNTSDAINSLSVLTASNFDVVNLAPIVTGLSPTNALPGATVTVQGQNFSGAAGRISVLFGTNATGPVNVLSDSQIFVTVPTGSGTVDVKVQSGTNETDNVSDSPGANVNKPIFGYGTNIFSAADHFTFTPPPPPTFQRVLWKSGNIILSGTNNNGSGGTYHVLGTTNLLVPRTNWTVLTNTSFDASGNFNFTNAPGTNRQQFYIIQVP